MANWKKPTSKEKMDFREWCKGRPEEIAHLAQKFPPWKLYRLKTSDQRVVVSSYLEAGAHIPCVGHTAGPWPNEPHCDVNDKPMLTVVILGLFNRVAFERRVTVDPDSLEECDLPDSNQLVGSADLSEAELNLPEGERTAIMLNRASLGCIKPFHVAMKDFLASR